MREEVRPGDVLGRHERRERHHLAARRPGVELRDVGRVLPEAGVGLDDDVPDAAVLVELAHRQRAELGLQGVVDVLDRHPEEHRLLAVDRDLQLPGGGAERAVDRRELGPLLRLGHELLREVAERRRVSADLVLDPHLEAARRADPGDGGRRDREDGPGVDVPAPLVDRHEDGLRVLLLRLLHRLVALLERLQRDEDRRGVRLDLPVEDAVAVDRHPVGDRRVLREEGVHPVRRLDRPVEAGGVGHDDPGEDGALVLVRDEGGRDRPEELEDGEDEDGEDRERHAHPLDDRG